MLIGGVATPQRLDESGGRLASPDHVLLPLLLLHLQREPAAQDALHTCAERGG